MIVSIIKQIAVPPVFILRGDIYVHKTQMEI